MPALWRRAGNASDLSLEWIGDVLHVQLHDDKRGTDSYLGI